MNEAPRRVPTCIGCGEPMGVINIQGRYTPGWYCLNPDCAESESELLDARVSER